MTVTGTLVIGNFIGNVIEVFDGICDGQENKLFNLWECMRGIVNKLG